MTSQYRHRRRSDPSATFTALEPGEIGVNTSNRQLTVGDAASGTIGAPLPLLAIRIFDTRAIYAVGDYVTQAAVLYRAKQATGPGNFDATAWDSIAGTQVGPFVQRGGDTMFGHLALPTSPAASQAVRRDYVEAAIAPLATKAYVDNATGSSVTKSYVDSQDALAVPKSGSAMSGYLVLVGPPTSSDHAANKAYVDQAVAAGATAGIPVGAIMDFAMPNAPPGWIVCDGWAISRTDYAALFAAIGTTWGAGDGSTTFTLPNFTTRFRRHRDNNPSYAYIVGTYQSPCNLSHYHGVNINSGFMSADHQHYTSGTTGAADRSLDHLHTGGNPVRTGTATSGASSSTPSYGYVFNTNNNTGGMDRSIDHLHSFGAWSGGVNANHSHNVNGNTGGGSADSGIEARPYSATVLTCIKY